MNKRFLLVVMLALVSLIAVSCTCKVVFPETPFNGQPGEQPQGEPMIFFGADRTSIQPGECVTLQWHVEGEGFSGIELNGLPVDPSGQMQVCPRQTDVYTLGVDIGNSMLNREVSVSVEQETGQQQPQPSSPGCPGAPLFTHFEANPNLVVAGQSTNLEWGPITNGTTGELVGSVVLTPGNFGEVSSPGSRQVSPSTTTTYTLTATGCGGTATKTVTVSVNPPGGDGHSDPLPTPSGGGSWSKLPQVTSVVARAEPSSYTGPCPKTVTLSADITVDGPLVISYRWEKTRYDPTDAPPPLENVHFHEPGTWTTMVYKYDIFLSGPEGYTNQFRVNIFTPLPAFGEKTVTMESLMVSDWVPVKITCTQ
jgi:hypothetical protein